MWRLSPELLRNEATRGRPLAAVFPPCRSRGTFLPLAGEGGGGGRPSSFLHRRSPRGSPLSSSPPRGERTPSAPGRDGAFVPPTLGQESCHPLYGSRGTSLPLAGEGGEGGRPSSFHHRRSPRGSPLSNSPPRGERTPSSPGRARNILPPTLKGKLLPSLGRQPG